MICSSAGTIASRAVDAEALGADETKSAEFLEAFGLDQLVQDRALAFGRERNLLVRPFDAPLQPILLLGIGDVHELIADAPAIGALEEIDHLARRGGGKPQHAVDEDGLVEFGIVETVEARIELRHGGLGRQMQRIEIGREMPDHAIGAHHAEWRGWIPVLPRA